MQPLIHTFFSGKIPVSNYDQSRQFYDKLMSMGYSRRGHCDMDRLPNFSLLKWFFVYSDRTFVCSYSADAENVNLPLFKEPAVKPSVWNRKYVSGKVVVKNSEHAKRLITKLFQMGYQWQSATCSVPSDAVIKQIRWIFLFDNGIMECIFAHELGMNTESKEYRIIKP